MFAKNGFFGKPCSAIVQEVDSLGNEIKNSIEFGDKTSFIVDGVASFDVNNRIYYAHYFKGTTVLT